VREVGSVSCLVCASGTTYRWIRHDLAFDPVYSIIVGHANHHVNYVIPHARSYSNGAVHRF
jgi:hypothetical protein